MEASYQRFVRSSLADGDEAELSEVDRLAGLVKVHLDEQADAIDEAHVHRASSGAIQSIVSRLLREQLDFGEERILTPEHGFVTQARPDFFYRLGESRGILAEVERGGTTTNNHDPREGAHLARHSASVPDRPACELERGRGAQGTPVRTRDQPAGRLLRRSAQGGRRAELARVRLRPSRLGSTA